MTYVRGLKELTVENWLQPDEIMGSFVRPRADGRVAPITSNDWAEDILAVRLACCVPEEIKDLFAVARGAMLYGYYFYPLYALASEQLFRVAEAAVARKAEQLGCPKGKKKFVERVEWLSHEGVLTTDEEALWHTTRDLRNDASHPSEQTILLPGQALGVLNRTADMVSQIFE